MDETRVLEQLAVVAPDIGRQQELRDKLQALFSSVGEKKPYVSGRELHDFLEVNTEYRHWMSRMINQLDLTEGKDLNPVKNDRVAQEGDRQVNRTVNDHLLTIEACKEIAQIQRSDLGKLVRRYLIWAEEQFRYQNLPSYQIEDPIERARRWANEQERLLNQIAEHEETIHNLAPYAEHGIRCMSSPNSITVGELANRLNQNGYRTGQNRLFQDLVSRGYLYRRGKEYRAYQRYLATDTNEGLFDYTYVTFPVGDDPNGGSYIQVKVTSHGQKYFERLYTPSDDTEE